MRSRSLPLLAWLLLASCLPQAHSALGKLCDAEHACGEGLECREGVCAEPLDGGAPACSGVDPMAHGAVGDGVHDDTAAFQAAADTREPVCVRKPSAYYRLTDGIHLWASIAGDGSKPHIKMEGATGAWAETMLQVSDYSGPGLIVQGLHLDGGWAGATTAEHSHIIYIAGSKKVTVEGNLLENPFGDGIYVGGGPYSTARSEEITIRDNEIVNPRRCDITIVSAQNVTIAGNTLRKANNYIASMNLQPMNADSIWQVLVDANRFDVPLDNALSLYQDASSTVPPGGDITISNNTGRATSLLVTSGDWVRVVTTGNTVAP